MIKVFSTVILLFLISVDLSFAQEGPGAVKIYSGFLYQQSLKSKGSFWHALFGAKSSKQEVVVSDKQCSVEFHSPIPFSHEAVTVVPEQLTYFIRFKNDPNFSKFIIKIFSNSDEEYTIDPDSEGKQVGISDEHRIFDSYLIYLILGSDINHLEVTSPSSSSRYILDKLEVHDNR